MSSIDTYTKEERKANGVFYTPLFLADYLAKKVIGYYGIKRPIKSIFDPACGNGILLQSFANELLNRKPASNSLIVGMDKDINAVASSISSFVNIYKEKINTQFIHADALFPKEKMTSIEGWLQIKKDLGSAKGFDIALCNPPWGADLSAYEQTRLNKNFALAKGQFDVFDLFTEVVLNNIAEDGVYGLILPDSVFGQDQARFRSLLSTHTTIHLIIRLGEKIFPEINRACMIIVGGKSIPRLNHQVDCIRLSANYKKRVIANEMLLEEVEAELLHRVPQSRFSENGSYLFDIDLKTDEQPTFNKIAQNSKPLQTYVEDTRGAEISKKGMVCQCVVCKYWMPYPKLKITNCTNCHSPINIDNIVKDKIVLDHNGIGNVKLKVGEDLFRFTSLSKSWINTLKQGINYKDRSIYAGDKILVRKTGIGITASIDYENSITNQVVYILKLKPNWISCLSLEFVLAVLNSRVMTYYLIKQYGENEWKTHPYLTQSMLIRLPFPEIKFGTAKTKRLIELVTTIIRQEVTNSKEKNISKENDIFIERVIADFFDLTEMDYKVIFATLESSQQLIPIKRLLNCSAKSIFEINGI